MRVGAGVAPPRLVLVGPRVLVIDNYDSFVFNLVQYLGELGATPIVVRNDEMSVEEIETSAPDGILISPGPGDPSDAGVSMQVIRELGEHIPVWGVCLGHQCIGEVYGGTVVRAAAVMHGKTSMVDHDQRGVFAGLESPLEATRYHSLVVAADSIPAELEVTATTADGTIMGLRHRRFPVEGVQFHPESILTSHGHAMVANFLRGLQAP